MTDLDRTTARALVEVGYMPLNRYIDLFGFGDFSMGAMPSIVPHIEDEHPGQHTFEAPLRFWRRLMSMH
ncbi:MAG: hypothetical protein WA792_12825 [Pseudolabrys sp.]